MKKSRKSKVSANAKTATLNEVGSAMKPRIIINEAQGMEIELRFFGDTKSIVMDAEWIFRASLDNNIKIGFKPIGIEHQESVMSPLEFALGKNAPCNCKSKRG